MKKEFDMSDLVENLASDTGGNTEQNRVSKTRRQSTGKKKMEHVCTLVDIEQMAKVFILVQMQADMKSLDKNFAYNIRVRPEVYNSFNDYFKDDKRAILGEFGYYLSKFVKNGKLNP